MLTTGLNKRFCRDTGTSITVFIDPYFSERLKLLGLEAKYSDFEKMINEQFGGIEQRYFEYCEQVEKEVIAFLKDSESLKGLQTCDMSKYKNPFSIPSGNVYKGDNIGKTYISIDMAKANFSALVHYEKEIGMDSVEKSFGQLCGYDYNKFIGHFTDNKFVAESKYVRQYIFGHCCSKRVVNYEKWIMGTVMDKLPASAVSKTVTLNNDEIIIDADDLTLEEVNGLRILIEQLSKEVVPLHFEYFTLKGFYGTEQKVFMKQFIDEDGQQNGYKLACNNSIDTVFIEKYLHGIEITDNDLVFNCQYGLAKLLKVPEAYTEGIKDVNEKYRELFEGSEYNFIREHSRLGKNLMILVVSGSKAHGTDTPTSDTDIRGVMCNSVNELVKVERDFGTFIEKDTDTCIHTFDKTCDLMLSCNPSVMEMFGCRDEEIIYYDKHGKMLMDNYDKFLSIRAVSSFGGFANGQFNRMKHSLIANGQNPDTELEMLKHSLDNAMTAFNATHQGTAIDVQIRMVSDQELKRIHPEIKTKSEYDKHHILVNGQFNEVDVTDFKTVISELHKIQSEYGKLNKENTKKTDVKLAKHMMDLVYIYLVGADLNSGKGMITYREKEHDMLMDIRNMKYLTSDGLKVKSDFYDLLNDVEKEYMYTAKNCVLSEEPDYEAISDMKRQVYLDILAR